MKTKLKEILDVKVGYLNHKAIKENANADCRIIQAKNFNDEGKLESTKFVRFEPEYSLDEHFIIADDVLFHAKGRNNFAYVVTEQLENTVAANSFYILRSKKKIIDPKFLEWTLNHGSFPKKLKRLLQETALPYILKRDFENLTIDVPDMKTQKNIAKIIVLTEKRKYLSKQRDELQDKFIQQACRDAVKKSDKEKGIQ